MAVITGGNGAALDMYETYLGSAHPIDVTEIASDHLILSYPGGHFCKLVGTGFSFDSDGYPTAGTVQSAVEYGTEGVSYDLTTLCSLPVLFGQLGYGAFEAVFSILLQEDNTFYGSDHGDRVLLLTGQNNIFGGIGADEITTGSGNSVVHAGAGDDMIFAGEGDDYLNGEAGADQINGGAGNDQVLGGPGDDYLLGGAGNDILDGGLGGDRLEGGPGNDVYIVDHSSDMIIELSGEGFDQVLVTAETFAMADNLEQLSYVGTARIVAYGNALDNSMQGGGKTDFLSAFDGNDLLNGWAGDDVIYGGNGDDTIIGGTGADTLYGGEGTDTLVLAGVVSDYTVAKSGDTWLVTGGSTDTVSGFEKVLVGNQTLALDEFVSQAFDGLRYIASHPDLIRAFGANAVAGKQHYLDAGQGKGRSLTSFDPLIYAASNPDVFKAFGEDRQALTRHYIENGFAEGRSTNSFDPIIYAASNLDVARAFGYDREALTQHYLEEGLRQGRDAHSFDPLRYAASNPDVAQAFGTDTAALTRHWIDNGSVEGRSTTSFDARQYAAVNPDVAQAFGTDLNAITVHYIQEGIAQHRATSGFDAVAYLLSYEDLGAAHLGVARAFDHWLSDGIAQHRTGDALFGREQANHVLQANGTTSATFESAGDHDWFQFTASTGQRVTLDLHGQAGALELHRADGSLVGASINGTLDVTTDAAGTFYLATYTYGSAFGAYNVDLHVI